MSMESAEHAARHPGERDAAVLNGLPTGTELDDYLLGAGPYYLLETDPVQE
ncbi:hypothetical protein ACFQ08_13595 [Streptosporangium algeriense]|uniref:Uncharacterized protein n=1 Tax=Streptosporangium algeriense TaxID=1682748 RepID=A0ABW3DQZ2_9ACTN